MAVFTMTVADVAAFVTNVAVSVLIVFANKVLMAPPVAFAFATCLCAMHNLAAGGAARLIEGSKTADKGSTQKSENVPPKVYFTFAVVSSASIASLNISLLLNNVGFYQVAKLLVIPFVCLVEALWLKRHFRTPIIMSIVVVVVGVGIVTVADVEVNLPGLIVAGMSVVCSGMQQILCGTIQRNYDVSANQLLSLSAPIQGTMLLLAGPPVDKLLSDRWIFGYIWTMPAVLLLILSCTLAVGVNISQFMVLGRFSAVTFQVLGHTKTVLVLVFSWVFLKESCTARKMFGMALAVVGMAAYGYFSANAPRAAALVPETVPETDEKVPLLDKLDKDQTLGTGATGNTPDRRRVASSV